MIQKRRRIDTLQGGTFDEAIPNEVLIRIMENFDYRNLIRMRGVNKRFKLCAESAYLWKLVWGRHPVQEKLLRVKSDSPCSDYWYKCSTKGYFAAMKDAEN